MAAVETGPKSESIPKDARDKMSKMIAETNTFTAWYKKQILSLPANFLLYDNCTIFELKST